jgi:hypothetical protein
MTGNSTSGSTASPGSWGARIGRCALHLREIGEPIHAVAFSPDGTLVVTASRDGAEQVWDARSGVLHRQFNALHSKILSVELDLTSKLVVAAGVSGAVIVADAVRPHAASSVQAGTGRRGCGMRPRRIAAGARRRSAMTAASSRALSPIDGSSPSAAGIAATRSTDSVLVNQSRAST